MLSETICGKSQILFFGHFLPISAFVGQCPSAVQPVFPMLVSQLKQNRVRNPSGPCSDKHIRPISEQFTGNSFLSSAGVGKSCVLPVWVPNPSPTLDKNLESIAHGSRNFIQYWGWGMEESF